MATRIPVSSPVLGGNESRYVLDALQKGDISGLHGDYLARFESGFADYCGVRHAVTTSSGLGALHLALAALGIGPGDEVLTSTLTNMATFFAGIYLGATMRPIDVEPETLNLNPALLEAQITPRTRAILVVHLYGHPVDMDPVNAIARKHGLKVIEDAAEAHGATYRGRRAGSLGDIGCFSFYANKILTTGEGGMVTTDDPALAERVRSLKGMAYGKTNRFMHEAVGFNYRMTNLTAALGCAQLERIEEVIAAKRRLAAFYDRELAGCAELQLPVEKPWARNVYWMYHVGLRGPLAARRAWVTGELARRGIETRDCFIPANQQQLFLEKGWTAIGDCPVANDIAARGFYLPSGTNLSDAQLETVVRELKSVLAAGAAL